MESSLETRKFSLICDRVREIFRIRGNTGRRAKGRERTWIGTRRVAKLSFVSYGMFFEIVVYST